MSQATTAPTQPIHLSGDWAKMRAIVPRSYVCRRAPAPFAVDGTLRHRVWKDAPWTEDFIDIEGPAKPAPRFRTRAKMLWDDEHLYVCADLDEPNVVATLTEKNSIIYNDNDFEIFIDPDGDHHNYYEFEMNALNTIWELTLPRPYKDGGDPKLRTNLPGLKSAVHVRGTINDASDRDDGWSVEVAIPWKELAVYNPSRATPPRESDVWRINFSRVQWMYDVVDGKYVRRPKEKSPEDNWVWSPQGVVDMHRPERWGMVVFTHAAPDVQVPLPVNSDTAIAERDALMELYYRQRAFHNANKRYARSLAELGIDSTCITLLPREKGYVATIEYNQGDERRAKISIDNTSRLALVP